MKSKTRWNVDKSEIMITQRDIYKDSPTVINKVLLTRKELAKLVTDVLLWEEEGEVSEQHKQSGKA